MMVEMSSRQNLYPTITSRHQEVFVFIYLLASAKASFISTANEDTDAESKTCGKVLVVLASILVVLTMPFSLFVCFKVSD